MALSIKDPKTERLAKALAQQGRPWIDEPVLASWPAT